VSPHTHTLNENRNAWSKDFTVLIYPCLYGRINAFVTVFISLVRREKSANYKEEDEQRIKNQRRN